jgi:hypothetical protein
LIVTSTKVLTEPQDILNAMHGATVAEIRITDEGIVTGLTLSNGVKMTGGMIVEEP